MQVWHGSAYVSFSHLVHYAQNLLTYFSHSDTTLYPQNFFEEVKQWTTIFGYSSPISNITESYLPNTYHNATYGPKFQAIYAQGVGHTVPLYEQQYLQFLGIA